MRHLRTLLTLPLLCVLVTSYCFYLASAALINAAGNTRLAAGVFRFMFARRYQ